MLWTESEPSSRLISLTVYTQNFMNIDWTTNCQAPSPNPSPPRPNPNPKLKAVPNPKVQLGLEMTLNSHGPTLCKFDILLLCICRYFPKLAQVSKYANASVYDLWKMFYLWRGDYVYLWVDENGVLGGFVLSRVYILSSIMPCHHSHHSFHTNKKEKDQQEKT